MPRLFPVLQPCHHNKYRSPRSGSAAELPLPRLLPRPGNDNCAPQPIFSPKQHMVFVLSERRVRHLHCKETIENIGIELFNLIDYDAILFKLKILNAPSLGRGIERLLQSTISKHASTPARCDNRPLPKIEGEKGCLAFYTHIQYSIFFIPSYTIPCLSRWHPFTST